MAAQPLGNLVSKAFGIGEAAAAVHIQEVSRVVFKVGQWQGVLLAEMALRLRFQERTLVVGEGHGEKGIGVADKLVDVSFPSHLKRENTPYEAQLEQGVGRGQGTKGRMRYLYVTKLSGSQGPRGSLVADYPNHSDLF